MHLAEVSARIIRRVLGPPDETPDPPPRHHFIQQHLQLRPALVIDADEQHAILPQKVAGDDESLVKKLDPRREPPRVVFIHEAVVIDKVLLPRVVGRINEDALHPPGVSHAQVAQGVEVIPLDDEIPPRRRAHALVPREVERHKVRVDRLVAVDLIRLPHQAKAGGIPPVTRLQEPGEFVFGQMVVSGGHRGFPQSLCTAPRNPSRQNSHASPAERLPIQRAAR